jgi:hypothetical protein
MFSNMSKVTVPESLLSEVSLKIVKITADFRFCSPKKKPSYGGLRIIGFFPLWSVSSTTIVRSVLSFLDEYLKKEYLNLSGPSWHLTATKPVEFGGTQIFSVPSYAGTIVIASGIRSMNVSS